MEVSWRRPGEREDRINFTTLMLFVCTFSNVLSARSPPSEERFDVDEQKSCSYFSSDKKKKKRTIPNTGVRLCRITGQYPGFKRQNYSGTNSCHRVEWETHFVSNYLYLSNCAHASIHAITHEYIYCSNRTYFFFVTTHRIFLLTVGFVMKCIIFAHCYVTIN